MPGFEDLWFVKADALQQQADRTVERALRAAGWEYTCNTPGSVWMWQKEIDGATYRMSRENAARIQEDADRDAYFDQNPDEIGD